MTAAVLKLDVQHQVSPIGQRHPKDLVSDEEIGREFDVERTCLTHRAVKQTGSEIIDKQTDQALQRMIGCGHAFTVLTRATLEQGSIRHLAMASASLLTGAVTAPMILRSPCTNRAAPTAHGVPSTHPEGRP
jgi:hypothetical protein